MFHPEGIPLSRALVLSFGKTPGFVLLTALPDSGPSGSHHEVQTRCFKSEGLSKRTAVC